MRLSSGHLPSCRRPAVSVAPAYAERLTDKPLVDSAWLAEHLGK